MGGGPTTSKSMALYKELRMDILPTFVNVKKRKMTLIYAWISGCVSRPVFLLISVAKCAQMASFWDLLRTVQYIDTS